MPIRHRTLAACLSTACLLAAGSAVAAARLPPARPLSPLALSCQGCHQPAVNAPTMPSLAGHSAARIAAALKTARDEPKPGSIMARFAQYLSDAEIAALAAELGASAAP